MALNRRDEDDIAQAMEAHYGPPPMEGFTAARLFLSCDPGPVSQLHNRDAAAVNEALAVARDYFLRFPRRG